MPTHANARDLYISKWQSRLARLYVPSISCIRHLWTDKGISGFLAQTWLRKLSRVFNQNDPSYPAKRAIDFNIEVLVSLLCPFQLLYPQSRITCIVYYHRYHGQMDPIPLTAAHHQLKLICI